jgi:hypothetical protein
MSTNSTNSFLENQNDIDNKPFSKKIIFNTMWERDINGIRKIELDAFRCLNSNVFNFVGSLLPSPIDANLTRTYVTIFVARKRLIKLIDIWNRILNSGLLKECIINSANKTSYYKYIGANIRNIFEYPFKDFNTSTNHNIPISFKTDLIFYQLQRFITSWVNNYNAYEVRFLNNQTVATTGSLFNINSLSIPYAFSFNINPAYNPTLDVNLNLMEELLNLYKELISEQKVNAQPDLGFNFDNLTFLTEQGRGNILKLDAYKSNYKAIAKIDIEEFNYLNSETKALVIKWIETGANLDKLYPQFASEIYRNEENETWNYKNAMVKLNSISGDESFTEENIGVTTQELQNLKAKKHWVGSILDMKKPLYFNTQFINWENPDDRPYIMLYNGGTLIHIPDQLKELTNPDTFNTAGEAPDNQINLSAYFWKIGTSAISDPLYEADADIKLNLGQEPLQNLDKLDFFDNLQLYLKIN